jgi:PAS domain S-box-containing protein
MEKARWIGILALLAVFYWLVDVVVDSFIFGHPFEQSLIHPSTHELWMRGITILFILILAVVAKTLINKKKAAERTSDHLNRVLRAIRNVNQLITTEPNENRLLQQSCKLLTETRGYKGALMILIDNQGNFKKLAESGWKNRRNELEDRLQKGEFIECIKKSLTRQGVILIEDTLKECRDCPLAAEATNHRSLTCRLEHEGSIFGLISVKMPGDLAELQEEQNLVEEVAGDIAFALHKIRTENQLMDTEKQYRVLTETARDIICIHDMDGNIQYLNSAGLKTLGKSIEEIRGENIYKFIQSSEGLNERINQRLNGDQSTYTYETMIRHPSGRQIPLEISSSPIEREGKTEGILLIARDITERKQSQEHIQQYIQDLQIIYEVTSNLLKAATEEEILETIGQRIQVLNPNAYIMLSAVDENSPETLRIKKNYGFEQVHDELVRKAGLDFQDILIKTTELTDKNNQRLVSGKFQIIDGGLYELSNYTIPEQTSRQIEEFLNVDRIYSMGIVHNGITRGGITIMLREATGFNKQTLLELLINQASVALSQKQSEKALKIAKDKAEESDRLKSAFLMNLSHEIRTPLNGIMGFSQILQEREFTFEKQKEFLNIVHEKADQLLHILNNILDLSKIEAKQMNIRQKDFYLNDMIHELYDHYLLELEKKGKKAISLSYYCGLEREKSRLYSDRERLHQVLSNLLSNAVKFTEEGSITFGYDITDQETLFFYVRDTGIGIPDQKREEIFEPFRQADDSTNRAYEGTGLGLSLAAGLVEILGGKIWMESEKGKGTHFYFTIPFAHHKFKQGESERLEEGEAYLWPGQRIMIVEDDPVSLEFMQEIFSETEVKLITAQTGEEALHRYRDNPEITLVLMDIRLPDMSGLDVVKQIRKQNSHVPIIAQTAYTMDNDARKCKEAGCNDYLTKPIDIQAMLSVINKHLKKHTD